MAKAKKQVIFTIVKRAVSIIHYHDTTNEKAGIQTLDLAGFAFRNVRKGITFSFAGDGTAKAENVYYHPARGMEPRFLVKAAEKAPVKAGAKATARKASGATPYGSLLRKY